MRERKLQAIAGTLAWLLAAAIPARAVINETDGPPPKGPQNQCSQICVSGDCSDTCISNGAGTTCAQYFGAPATDWDRDGIQNSADNCLCTANANQADCDGDHAGDACDPNNEKWVQLVDAGACGWRGGSHVGYFSVDLKGQRTWKNVCNNNATCNQIYTISSANCYWGSAGGTSQGACCDVNFGVILSPGATVHHCFDNCASYTCPF